MKTFLLPKKNVENELDNEDTKANLAKSTRALIVAMVQAVADVKESLTTKESRNPRTKTQLQVKAKQLKQSQNVSEENANPEKRSRQKSLRL
jgi:hypothetical protein